jgi:SAM-dependent methyltransferase
MSDEPDFITSFPDILAPFVPTPPDVVERMLELANTGGDDFVVDLGCGDGRILITAAKKYGARGLGVDIEQYRIKESETNAKNAGVEQLLSFERKDATRLDLSGATVITLYLVHWSVQRLQPIIRKQAKCGTRIVSHNFPMTEWEPSLIEEFVDSEGAKHTLFLWIVK